MLEILILGAGLAGLSLAKLLSGQGRTIGILDRRSFATLENPTDDGIKIARNQRCRLTTR
ncbi:MAG: NAD(P)-binding protein [Methylophilaceae bacterium]